MISAISSLAINYCLQCVALDVQDVSLLPQAVQLSAINQRDPEAEHRTLAAQTFQQHFSNFAEQALNQIFTMLLSNPKPNPLFEEEFKQETLLDDLAKLAHGPKGTS